MCNEAVEVDPYPLEFAHLHLRTDEMCRGAVEKYLHPMRDVPDHLKTQEMCNKAVEKDPWQLGDSKPKGCVKEPLKMNQGS